MKPLLVLENPARWDFDIPGVEVIAAKDYLLDPERGTVRDVKVFNLCRSYEYQSAGYYVSLLASARRHRPIPTLATLQDLRDRRPVRLLSEDTDELVQKSLSGLKANAFILSVYFGQNLARRYERLASALFNEFPAPFLRAEFSRRARRPWRLDRIRAIATADIPAAHRAFVTEQAARYFARPRPARRAAPTRYDLAIFVNPSEEDPPSDARAIRRFVSAAERIGIRAEVIDKADAGRLSEFDALFLRETTYVNHMTYRLASRAERDGLVVIDDPESILRCTNKVFQAETFQRANIPAPPTWIVHEGTVDRLVDEIDYPCVVKQPDSAFSKGVARAHDERELRGHLARYLAESALVLVQRFVPSEFDWRVGILAGEPLYVCRYFMAKGHWTIQVSGPGGGRRYGKVETLAVEDAPKRAVNLARRVARQFGDGLYGIDIKESNGRFMVIEVNDNPSIESGFEDRVLGKELYGRIMADFLRRLEARRAWPKGTAKAAGTSSR